MVDLDLDLPNRAVRVLDDAASNARNRADADAEPAPLADLIRRTLSHIPRGTDLFDPGVRRELAAHAPGAIANLEAYFDADLEQEAQVRGRLAAARLPLPKGDGSYAEVMRKLRCAPRDVRHDLEVRVARDDALEAFCDFASSLPAPRPADVAPPPPPPPLPTTAAGLVLPDAATVALLTAGADFDPNLQTTARVAPPPFPQVAPPDASEPSTWRFEWRDFLAALFESVSPDPPGAFGDWLGAATGAAVAEYRLRPVSILAGAAARRALPFEQPGVPLARPGAVVGLDRDAWALSTHLLALGPGAPAALACSAPLAPFLRHALEDPPADPLRASRALVLALGLRAALSRVAHEAAGDPELLGTHARELLNVELDPWRASLMASESGLARLPGERQALYAHTADTARRLETGCRCARVLRERFDEDWFRNPRVTWEVAESVGVGEEPDALLGWLVEAARL